MTDKTAIILDLAGSAYLPGTKTAITVTDSVTLFTEPDKLPLPFKIGEKESFGIVPWGDENTLPSKVTDACEYNPVITSGLWFNITVGYGSGIAYGKYILEKNKRVFVEEHDNDIIGEFFYDNDIQLYLLEQMTDLNWYYNVFPEISLNRNNNIVKLISKEAAFSRWESMNPKTGLIENHFYSAKWSMAPDKKDVFITPALDPRNTLTDLKVRMGTIPDPKTGKKRTPSNYRFIIPVSLPTPGRSYYQKPYWYSIIKSGWLDYSRKIPEFKNALLDNQMTIKYHVELSTDYFDTIYAQEGITTDDAKRARIKKEYSDLNKFLSNVKNSGKSVISFIRYSADGKEMRRMKISAIENHFKGGEYIDDSEEASNIMSYGLGVHPSLIGSSPGKNKSLSGTEARELFIIKQAMMKPIRDRILRPLYLIKHFNNWPKDIHFEIPHIVLTTLDRGTGSEKIIS